MSTRHVYLSRDVVFDENMFPFSKLHQNVGAQLCSEINLLDLNLLPYGAEPIANHATNHHPANTNSLLDVDGEN